MFAARKLLVLFGILSFSGPGFALAAAGKIEKVGVGSSVKVVRAGESKRLKEGDALESGDELSTDANTAVDIRLEDDTLIRLGMNSSYKVQEDSKIHSLVHRLITGVVRVLVKPAEGDKKEAAIKFRLYTPEGTIGVRGTEFVVIRDQDRTELKGLDGVVVFGPADTDFNAADKFVRVERGFQSSVSAKGGLAKPGPYDVTKYKDLIDSATGPFGPLAGRVSGANKHVRSDKAISPPSLAKIGGGKSAEVAAAPPKAKKKDEEKFVKVDYQLMLFKAAEKGNIKEAKLALKKGANVNGKNELSLGHTPLQIAMLFRQEKMFTFLILNGADVETENEDGLTPLMFVAQNKLDMDYAKALVNPGAAFLDTVKKDTTTTALDIAKKVGYDELATYLASKESENDYNKAVEEKKNREKKKKAGGSKDDDDDEE